MTSAIENEVFHVLPAQRRQTRPQEPPFVNDPRLYTPVRVKILRPFWFKHKVLERGAVIDLPKVLADDALAIKRAERVE